MQALTDRAAFKLLRRLDDEEQGTAMTEFVICLPIFIFIFIGIADLYRLHNKTSTMQITAVQQMWSKAMPIQKNALNLQYMNAQVGAGVWTSTLSQRGNMSALATVNEAAVPLGMVAGGHFGESFARTKLISPLGINSRVPAPPGTVKAFGKDVVKEKTAELLVSDHLGGQAMLTLGPAAGIRYGMVGANQSASVPVNLIKKNIQLSVGFDTIVAPYPHRNVLAHGATMLGVQSVIRQQKYVTTIFGINLPRFNASN